AYNNRGNVRADQGDLAGAVADYTRAIDLAPGLWQPWGKRGVALARLGRMDEAEASFERALELAPPSMRPQVEAARRQAMGR
ncbi:MAG: tetratricopeptide repeat protein, partial [Planctomycetes bacterium]|nr:tetratricopeptide repeat protein [Planctomycetota bacterium]